MVILEILDKEIKRSYALFFWAFGSDGLELLKEAKLRFEIS